MEIISIIINTVLLILVIVNKGKRITHINRSDTKKVMSQV
jgi:hypothetical protein